MTCGTFSPKASRARLASVIRHVTGTSLEGMCILGVALLGGLWMVTMGEFAGGFSIVFVVGMTGHILKKFSADILENPDVASINTENGAEYLSFDIVRHMSGRKDAEMPDILNAILKTEKGEFVCEALGLTATDIAAAFKKDMGGLTPCTFIDACLEKDGKGKIGPLDAMSVLFERSTALQSLLNGADVSKGELNQILEWALLNATFSHRNEILSPGWIQAVMGSFGRSWTTGYTDDLDRLTTDIGDNIVHKLNRPVVIHQNALSNVMRIIQGGTQSNVIVLGPTGSGKRALIENVAFSLQKQELDNAKSFTRILQLRTEQLMSGMRDADTFLLHALTRAESSGRFVLVLKDIAQLLKSSDAKLKGVLYRFLQARHINIIGIATIDEYHSIIKDDPQLDALFQKIYLEEGTDDETLHVLMERYLKIHKKHGTKLTFKALKSVQELTKRFVARGAFPGKAVNVLDEAYQLAQNNRDEFLREDHIRSIVSVRANINVQKMSQDEKQRLLTLEQRLKSRIIGQESALQALVSVLKRASMEIHSDKRPLGTFLFLGPTGVGKTETAKVLAEEYFGSNDRMIRVDLNEYSTADSVVSISGGQDSSGGFREGFLTKRVQDTPFSLILLDEIEKAHPNVLNLFLQILDEGALIDGRGMKTDFRNTIIIATSNAGALTMRELIQSQADMPKDKMKSALLDAIIKEKTFSPEFVNRFDEVVVYQPLTPDQTKRLAMQLVDSIIRDIETKKGIGISMTEEVLGLIGERGYSVQFGAREMRRTVQETIENYLADYLLAHDVKRGDTIMITHEELQSFLDKRD